MTFFDRRTETYSTGDNTWIGSEHGTESPESITLNPALFTLATHAPAGFYRSGTPLTKQGDGRYGPWATGSKLDGFLMTDVDAPPAGFTGNVLASLFWHGKVRLSRLPIAVDTAGQATNVLIRFKA